MAKPVALSLDAVRTDGWFERIGEGIGSFQALCEIVGERFVAFSLITGARITALSVDRRVMENTLVDFVVAQSDEDAQAQPQRLTLADFRRRLVAALLSDEPDAPVPARDTDLEALQAFVGLRTLLLAPIYGYHLQKLVIDGDDVRVAVEHEGTDEVLFLDDLRQRLRMHVRDELEKVPTSTNRGVIDLSRITEADAAAEKGDFPRVRQLLGGWPAPLSIFLRTPDGQMLGTEARSMIARALALLGSAHVALGDAEQGEEVFRLGVQYAQEGSAAAEVFTRLGDALLATKRPGEAVAALRRAINLGASGRTTWPKLADAFAARKRYVASMVCLREAELAGATDAELADRRKTLEAALGEAYANFRTEVLRA